jgi:IS30 family transposase
VAVLPDLSVLALMEHLRSQRRFRRSRHATQKTGVHGKIVGAVSISERPALVEDRAVPGHWEGEDFPYT